MSARFAARNGAAAGATAADAQLVESPREIAVAEERTAYRSVLTAARRSSGTGAIHFLSPEEDEDSPKALLETTRGPQGQTSDASPSGAGPVRDTDEWSAGEDSDDEEEEDESGDDSYVPEHGNPLAETSDLPSPRAPTQAGYSSTVDSLTSISGKTRGELESISDALATGLGLIETDNDGNTLVASACSILLGLGLKEADLTRIMPDSGNTAMHPTIARQKVCDEIQELAIEAFVLHADDPPETEEGKLYAARRARLLQLVDKSHSLHTHHKHVGEDKVRVARSIVDLRLQEVIKERKKMDADGWWRRCWDVVHLGSILFLLVAETTYDVQLKSAIPLWLFVTRWVILLFWAVEIVALLRIPAFDFRKYHLVTALKEKARLRAVPLAIDIICCIPIDLVLWCFLPSGAKDQGGLLPFAGYTGICAAYKVFRRLVLIKVLRLLYLFEFISVEDITPIHVDFFFLYKPLIIGSGVALLLTHGFTLLYGFTHPNRGVYWMALVDVLSMLTGTGPGVEIQHTLEAQSLAIVLIVIAVLFQGMVIGQMSMRVFRADIKAANVEKMRQTLAILTHYKVPVETMREILSYQLHALNDDADKYQNVLGALPEAMRREIVLYVRVDAIDRVALLAPATLECKIHLASTLTRCVASPLEDIVSIGDVGDEMFMISHGEADVIIVTGAVVATLSRGDYFGEIALVTEQCTRQATVRALGYCDMWALSRGPFMEAAVRFPKLCDLVKAHMELKKIDPAYFLNLVAEARRSEPPPPVPEAVWDADGGVEQEIIDAFDESVTDEVDEEEDQVVAAVELDQPGGGSEGDGEAEGADAARRGSGSLLGPVNGPAEVQGSALQLRRDEAERSVHRDRGREVVTPTKKGFSFFGSARTLKTPVATAGKFGLPDGRATPTPTPFGVSGLGRPPTAFSDEVAALQGQLRTLQREVERKDTALTTLTQTMTLLEGEIFGLLETFTPTSTALVPTNSATERSIAAQWSLTDPPANRFSFPEGGTPKLLPKASGNTQSSSLTSHPDSALGRGEALGYLRLPPTSSRRGTDDPLGRTGTSDGDADRSTVLSDTDPQAFQLHHDALPPSSPPLGPTG